MKLFSTHHTPLSGTTFCALLLALAVSVTSTVARADSGFYVGGSVGTAGIDLSSTGSEYDEDDMAWKAFGGFNFDLLVIDLAVEGGYVNFGSPSGEAGDALNRFNLDLDVTGLSGFGLVGVELGPIGVFAKIGVIDWDVDSAVDGIGQATESGTDPAYGIGARFSLFSAEIRAEYETFDINVDNVDSSDLDMISLGLVWTF